MLRVTFFFILVFRLRCEQNQLRCIKHVVSLCPKDCDSYCWEPGCSGWQESDLASTPSHLDRWPRDHTLRRTTPENKGKQKGIITILRKKIKSSEKSLSMEKLDGFYAVHLKLIPKLDCTILLPPVSNGFQLTKQKDLNLYFNCLLSIECPLSLFCQ